MRSLFRKTVDLVLHRRAIPRAYSLDTAGKERRTVEALPQDGVHLGIRISHPTPLLVFERWSIRERKTPRHRIAFLRDHPGKVQRTGVNPRRRPGLHAPCLETERHQRTGQALGRRLRNTAAPEVFFSDMDHPSQERPVGQHHSIAPRFYAERSPHALHRTVPHQNLCNGIGKQVQSVGMLQLHAPLLRKAILVALRTRTPHRRPFGTVEHLELDHRPVGYDARIPAERIHFAHDLSFGNTAHRGIARHLRHGLQVLRDEQRPPSHPRRYPRRLAAGMAATHYDHFVF